MNGEFNIKKFAAFLKSFWGILASFTVILPTIIYVLNSKQIKDSVLGDYYVGIPTTFAILVIPFVFLFEDNLALLHKARKYSIIFACTSLVALFTFITIKNIYIMDTYYTVSNPFGGGWTEIHEKRNGEIMLATYSYGGEKPKKEELRVNTLELISLVFYSISIILLTISFSTVGVFFYTKAT